MYNVIRFMMTCKTYNDLRHPLDFDFIPDDVIDNLIEHFEYDKCKKIYVEGRCNHNDNVKICGKCGSGDLLLNDFNDIWNTNLDCIVRIKVMGKSNDEKIKYICVYCDENNIQFPSTFNTCGHLSDRPSILIQGKTNEIICYQCVKDTSCFCGIVYGVNNCSLCGKYCCQRCRRNHNNSIPTDIYIYNYHIMDINICQKCKYCYVCKQNVSTLTQFIDGKLSYAVCDDCVKYECSKCESLASVVCEYCNIKYCEKCAEYFIKDNMCLGDHTLHEYAMKKHIDDGTTIMRWGIIKPEELGKMVSVRFGKKVTSKYIKHGFIEDVPIIPDTLNLVLRESYNIITKSHQYIYQLLIQDLTIEKKDEIQIGINMELVKKFHKYSVTPYEKICDQYLDPYDFPDTLSSEHKVLWIIMCLRNLLHPEILKIELELESIDL
jgi:hypothetical protein